MRLHFLAFIGGLVTYSKAKYCKELCDSYPPCRFSKGGSYPKENGACFGFYHKNKAFCFHPTEGQAACNDSELRPVFKPYMKHYAAKVLIIYTGGTIGMMPFPNGTLHPVKGYLTNQIHNLPELKADGMPEVTVIEWENLIDSSDMSPEGWVAMAKTVEDNYDKYDGFVILHGTDTMAYTSSALSFMFSDLAKTVIITGSILPFVEPHSDGRRNIIVSALLAGFYNIPQVSVFFDTNIIRGTRAVKVDSGAIEAFGCPRFATLATVDAGINVHDTWVPALNGPFEAQKSMEGSLFTIYMIPGLANLESLELSAIKGVILLLYGTGNAPSNQPHFTNWLVKLRDQGIPVIAVSQLVRGTVALGDYAAGSQLISLGVISAGDMTTEAATAKLSYLLAKGYDYAKIKTLFGKPLKGELTENSISDIDPFRGSSTHP